ncbi:MAG: putative lipid II flippase FtsW [Abditibacteriales bacterium]|nr:putative lipid II flippase FtsW [Abditibacteriales bacterium]MDW8364791.1 putative lipid II flippase FtsW [Abditibacteriales bacterium]
MRAIRPTPEEYTFSYAASEPDRPHVRVATVRVLLPAFDPWLLFLVFVLTFGGLAMLFSASYAIGIEQYQSPFYFVIRQAVWAALGFAAMLWVSCLDLSRLRAWSLVIYLGVLILLAAVLFTPWGMTHEHVRRWLKLPFLPPFQPSELAKIALVLVLAHCLGLALQHAHFSWWTWLGVVALSAPVVGLIFPEPHLSTAVLIVLTTMVMVFLAGAKWRQMGLVIAGVVVLSVFAYSLLTPYQRERIKSFFIGGDHQGSNYQAQQSVRALKEGGLWGKGFCQSQRKLFFLPAAHTDFIFAIIGEEFGLAGTLLTLSLFGCLIFKCYHLAHQCADPFKSLLCAGIGTLLALQVLINIGVATHLLPTTGVPLPFISSGGSALLCTLLGMGLVLNVSRSPREWTWRGHDEDIARRRWHGRTHLPGVSHR